MSQTGLYAKLARIAGELTWIDKMGWNDAQKYNYVKVEDILDAVRDKLAGYGIVFLPSAESVEVRESVSHKQHVTTVKMHYILRDTESGEECSATWFGTGADSGDKGLPKAYTAALKYFFIDLFQIPTGKDPDQEATRQQRAKPADRKLSVADRKRVLDAVMAAVTGDQWALFRSSLGIATDEELTREHAKQIRAWLDSRAKT